MTPGLSDHVEAEREDVEECDSEETIVVDKESTISQAGPVAQLEEDTHDKRKPASDTCLPQVGFSSEPDGLHLMVSSDQSGMAASLRKGLLYEGGIDSGDATVSLKLAAQSSSLAVGPLKASRVGMIKDEASGKVEKRDIKSTPDTSPDPDEAASEGFTTADFYIDESMPSSLTESVGRKLAELQQVIQDKTSQLEHKERELEEQRRSLDQLQPRLLRAQENFQLLHSVIQKGALQLRCDILNMEKQVQREKDDYQTFMDSVTKNLVDTIARFEAEQTSQRNLQLETLVTEHSTKVQKLEESLELEVEKLKDAQSEIDIYDRKLKEKLDELDCLKQDFEKQLGELNGKHEEEINTTKNQMLLEHEVEMEKVRSDLDVEVAKKDQELHDMITLLDVKDKEIEHQKLGKIHEEEVLCEKFQKEKQEIQTILQLEYNEKLKKSKEILEEKFRKSLEEETEKLKKDFEDKLQSETENINKNSEAEKDKVLCEMRAELEKCHTESTGNLQAEMMAEKEAELQQLRKEMEEEFERRMLATKEVFDADRQKLTEEKSNEIMQLEKRLEEIKLSPKEVEPRSDAVQLSEEDSEHEKLKVMECVSYCDQSLML